MVYDKETATLFSRFIVVGASCCDSGSTKPISLDMLEQYHVDQEFGPVIDVRSPSEYAHGHIPGAINLPLFSDDERAVIGTLYKQKGKDAAVLEGLRIVGPKMSVFVEEMQLLAPLKRLRIHCWRGGMRSGSMAWLFRQAGFQVKLLEGGYKTYRSHVRAFLEGPFRFCILGGATGSGKTEVLLKLKQMGEQVIDLEGLACHKGSSFGSLGQAPQPSIEQFENTLAFELKHYDLTKRIWIENESRKIGKVALSEGFWNQMLHAEIIAIQIPVSSRLDRLVNEYGSFSKVELQDALERIGKRLGPQHLKLALELLEEGNIRAVAEASLAYYDKAYAHGLQNRREHAPEVLSFDSFNPTAIATSLLDWTKTKNS